LNGPSKQRQKDTNGPKPCAGQSHQLGVTEAHALESSQFLVQPNEGKPDPHEAKRPAPECVKGFDLRTKWRTQKPEENWLKCARFGLQGLPIPEEYGGSAADILTVMLIMEGLGYGCRDNGLIFALNAQMWSVQLPILSFGTEAQKQKYLPGMIRGELIGAHGMTEPDSGSDAYSLRTRADRVEGGYVLNGSKMFVTSGPVADMALVFATIDPAKGRWGITAFLVDKGTTGFTLGGDMEKMGLRTAPLGELAFQDCFIPEENRLGREGAGASIFNSSMEWERSAILASHVGAM
jgi:alkylation response protein AidB-like acyl-CoA dehydrogenase